MHKIVIRQTSIVINDYNIGDCVPLEKAYSIYNEVYHTSVPKGIKYDAENRQLFIPKTTSTHWLQQLFNCLPYYENSCDGYAKNSDILIQYLPRDDVQKEALRFALGVQEYSSYSQASQQVLALNTGAGKTYIAISVLAYTLIKGIIITSSIEWLNQWKEKILEYTDIKPTEICMIQGASVIRRLLTKDNSKYKIYLASHNTIKSYGDTYGWDKITELFKCIKVGYKIYDEAHRSFENIYSIDYATNTFKTFYLSATPGRSDDKENQIYQRYIYGLPIIDLFDPENDPRTQYIAFKYNSRFTPVEQSNCVNKFGFNKHNYTNQVIYKPNFIYMLHVVMDMIRKTDGKVLMYISTNNAILYIYNWILTNYPEYNGNVGIFTSIIDDPIEKEEAKNKKIILSTTSSCAEAMDIPGLKMTVQLAEPMKSKIRSRQSLGRTRDRDTTYLDIIDIGVPSTKSYYMKRLPMFEKYATKCTEVNFKDDELFRTAERLTSQNQFSMLPRIDARKTIIRPFIDIDEEKR